MNDFYKGVSTMISLFFPNNFFNPLLFSGKYPVCSDQSLERGMNDQLHTGVGWLS
jgi:hypothetical protein